MRLNSEIYKLDALELAPKLIGMKLCRKIGKEIIKLNIIETEAYCGEADTACHAHKGKTERTKILYEQGGVAYVYLCYGLHNMLNVVSGVKNCPQAILVRGVEGFIGPGRLTKALQIDRSLNGENLITSDKLWIEYNNSCSFKYKKEKRVGIDYATPEYRDKLWRFIKI